MPHSTRSVGWGLYLVILSVAHEVRAVEGSLLPIRPHPPMSRGQPTIPPAPHHALLLSSRGAKRRGDLLFSPGQNPIYSSLNKLIHFFARVFWKLSKNALSAHLERIFARSSRPKTRFFRPQKTPHPAKCPPNKHLEKYVNYFLTSGFVVSSAVFFPLSSEK